MSKSIVGNVSAETMQKKGISVDFQKISLLLKENKTENYTDLHTHTHSHNIEWCGFGHRLEIGMHARSILTVNRQKVHDKSSVAND